MFCSTLLTAVILLCISKSNFQVLLFQSSNNISSSMILSFDISMTIHNLFIEENMFSSKCSPKTFFITFFPWFSENFRLTLVAKFDTWDFLENDLLIDERLMFEPKLFLFPADFLSKRSSSISGLSPWFIECCEDIEDLIEAPESICDNII